jgi:isocitrate lyase
LADRLGFSFYFNWDSCRTPEGYYKIDGCVDYCIRRGIRFAPYADMLWMETPTPDLNVAKAFSDGVHSVYPH